MSLVWDYLLSLNPDIALLQEVGAVPARVRVAYDVRDETPTNRRGTPQRFRTVILARGKLGESLPLRGHAKWIDDELSHFAGNLVASRAVVSGWRLNLIAVHSPAWPVDPARLVGADVGDVRLTLNRNVWVADLLWSALEHGNAAPEFAVIGGDFNLSETFDQWRGGPRGNREYLDRMAALGLTECLRTAKGSLTPTYRNTDKTSIKHQMDHLFVTADLARYLRSCDTGSRDEVFGGNLSDHLPIIADFTLPALQPDQVGEAI